MNLLKLLMLLIILNLISCSDNNPSNLALTCKNLYEGQKLGRVVRVNKKDDRRERKVNMFRKRKISHNKSMRRGNMSEKGNHACLKEMSDLCGVLFKVGNKNFLSCIEKKKSSISSKCLKLHEKRASKSKKIRSKKNSGRRKN